MIPAEEGHLRSSAFSHGGMGGKPNQDRYRVAAYTVGTLQRPSMLAILADGIGGRRAGEVAAELVLDTVERAVAQSYASQPTGILQAAIIQASQVVFVRGEEDARLQGMGSTCLVAWILEDRLYAASVGNSRLYLLRSGRLLPMNVVHDLVQEDDAENPPPLSGGKLRAFIGSHLPVDPDFRLRTRAGESWQGSQRNQGFRLQPNDRLLLCTDGLSDMLSDAEIAELLGLGQAEEAAEQLATAALKAGSQDNTTAVVLAVPPARPTRDQKRRLLNRRWAAVIIGSLLLVLIALSAWYFWVPLLVADPTPERTPLPTLTAQP